MIIHRYANPELISLNDAIVQEATVHFYVGSGRGWGRENAETEMMDNAGKNRKCGERDEIQTAIPAQKMRASNIVFATGKLQKYLQ